MGDLIWFEEVGGEGLELSLGVVFSETHFD